jgi:hypothetical protein
MFRRVNLVRIDDSSERISSIIRVTTIGDLGTTLVATDLRSVRRLLVIANIIPSSPILHIFMIVIRAYETSVLTRITRRNIPEDDILHGDRRENLKPYIKCHLFATYNIYNIIIVRSILSEIRVQSPVQNYLTFRFSILSSSNLSWEASWIYHFPFYTFSSNLYIKVK